MFVIIEYNTEYCEDGIKQIFGPYQTKDEAEQTAQVIDAERDIDATVAWVHEVTPARYVTSSDLQMPEQEGKPLYCGECQHYQPAPGIKGGECKTKSRPGRINEQMKACESAESKGDK